MVIGTDKDIAKLTFPIARKAVILKFNRPVITRHHVVVVSTAPKENARNHISGLDNVKLIAMLLEVSGPTVHEFVILRLNPLNILAMDFRGIVISL